MFIHQTLLCFEPVLLVNNRALAITRKLKFIPIVGVYELNVSTYL